LLVLFAIINLAWLLWLKWPGWQFEKGLAESNSAGQTKSPTTSNKRINPLLRPMGLSPEHIYAQLLGAHEDPSKAVVVEVGVYDGAQCRQAAEKGYKKVICFEPSPANYERSSKTVAGLQNVDLVQMAAGNVDGGNIEFHGIGGTGDHAGPVNKGEMSAYQDQAPIKIPVTTLDSYLQKYMGEIYLIKVDTQGYDGFVLEGMREILQSGAAKYIIWELWPTAMRNAGKPCTEVLSYLSGFDKYTAYELGLLGGAKDKNLDMSREWLRHPVDPDQLCKWYEELSNSFGLWSDILLQRN
jgi:FkbM family methyltransferase